MKKVIVRARETKITKGKEKKDENQKRGLTHFGKVKKWKDHRLKRQWIRK
jgi:hypothetical protein